MTYQDISGWFRNLASLVMLFVFGRRMLAIVTIEVDKIIFSGVTGKRDRFT
jgi:hypothetical protein